MQIKTTHGPDMTHPPGSTSRQAAAVDTRARITRGIVAELVGRWVKRGLDIAVSAVLLLVLAPVFAVIAIAIKVDGRGPVFYRAQRVGRNGRPLAVLKFRKMVDGARGSALTVSGDNRLTPVGRFLTEHKLDEMPQLWNVLRGGMSFIGPRPEDGKFVDLFPEEYANEILRVRPGITGLTQLAFAHESRLLDASDRERDYRERLLPGKVELDRLYVAKRSLLMDARIFLWTVFAIASGRDIAVNRRTGHVGIRRRTTDVAPVADATSDTARSDTVLSEAPASQ